MDDSPLKAGVSRTIITPPLGTYLIGYGDRTAGCTSVHDDLTATALLLDDGAIRLAILSLDMLALNEQVVARARQGIWSRLGIPADHIMICCSHTHSGPIAYADEESEPQNRQFIDGLVDKLVDTVVEADSALAPASLFHGQGEAHIAINRRQQLADGTVIIGVNPEGPVDCSLLVLQVRFDEATPAGQPVTLVNYACHPTILGPDSNAVSAEWPGVMRREVERVSDGLCLFLQGAAGDLNPNHEWGETDLAVMVEYGHEVAEQALLVIERGMEKVRPRPLGMVSSQLNLPIAPQSDAAGGAATYGEALANLVGIPKEGIDTILDERFPWKVALSQEAGRWHVPLEIQIFRIGDLALVAQAAEVFNEIGKWIKELSPAPITLFAGYGNGCIGYLATAAAHELGGYEVEAAPYFYRLPGLFEPSCAELVTDRTLQALADLFSEKTA